MSVMILALMMTAQAPAAMPPVSAPPVVKKQKPKQICQTVDVTGSRVPQRVCHDADASAPMEQDERDAYFGIAKIQPIADPVIVMPK